MAVKSTKGKPSARGRYRAVQLTPEEQAIRADWCRGLSFRRLAEVYHGWTEARLEKLAKRQDWKTYRLKLAQKQREESLRKDLDDSQVALPGARLYLSKLMELAGADVPPNLKSLANEIDKTVRLIRTLTGADRLEKELTPVDLALRLIGMSEQQRQEVGRFIAEYAKTGDAQAQPVSTGNGSANANGTAGPSSADTD